MSSPSIFLYIVSQYISYNKGDSSKYFPLELINILDLQTPCVAIPGVYPLSGQTSKFDISQNTEAARCRF